MGDTAPDASGVSDNPGPNRTGTACPSIPMETIRDIGNEIPLELGAAEDFDAFMYHAGEHFVNVSSSASLAMAVLIGAITLFLSYMSYAFLRDVVYQVATV